MDGLFQLELQTLRSTPLWLLTLEFAATLKLAALAGQKQIPEVKPAQNSRLTD